MWAFERNKEQDRATEGERKTTSFKSEPFLQKLCQTFGFLNPVASVADNVFVNELKCLGFLNAAAG